MELEKLVHWRVDREVRKKVIEAGDYNAVPYEDAKCIVIVSEVRCRDESGRECPLGVPTVLLDSQSAQSLLEWRVGMAENGLDRDIELVLRQMCRGERCIATLVYRSLQGKQLREVSCELHLKDVKETSLVADWSWQQLVCTAERHKERGVILVKEGRLQNAFILFSKAFKFLIALEPLELAELPADEHPRVLDLKVHNET
ncbi:hypothetical protein EVAR_83782_1 [Eumeta japonica]|uniref:BDBT FKBP like N-terminal domain-containing protein n=1 Tax=Eumeta variegata TaxID=151549 RepID=A0A4C1WFG8_EUMVA|nr:hypothetical protein EVAR_83782_1 [Eumeta japonica]